MRGHRRKARTDSDPGHEGDHDGYGQRRARAGGGKVFFSFQILFSAHANATYVFEHTGDAATFFFSFSSAVLRVLLNRLSPLSSLSSFIADRACSRTTVLRHNYRASQKPTRMHDTTEKRRHCAFVSDVWLVGSVGRLAA
ncbi:MAG TPA: hypothetical protein VGO47_04400 [Chlamydiales bacterium]|nr:hypothetical protein [Chlamydiales bacterium]